MAKVEIAGKKILMRGCMVERTDSDLYIHDLDTAIKSTVGIQQLRGQRILITGATGIIGKFLVDVLLRYNREENANNTIYIAVRNIDKAKRAFGCDGEVVYLQYDLLKKIAFDEDVDYIIHAAGNGAPNAFNGDPVGTIIGNVNGTFNILEYAKKKNVKRVLYISSGEVYGERNEEFTEFDEDVAGYINTTNPRSNYPLSKRMTENLCVNYSKQYGLDVVCVRLSHIYGPGALDEDNRVSATFFRNAVDKKDIELYSNGLKYRSYTYIADCISAILSVLLNGKNGETYNVASRDSRITILDFAKKIAKLGDVRVEFAASVDVGNDATIERQVLATDKIERLGWHALYSLDEGISNTYAIMKERI